MALAPYFQERRPAELFLEFLIVDVIEGLPEATIAAIEAFTEKTPAMRVVGEWRLHIRKSFNLSDTIDIAILDLWYRNGDIALSKGWKYHPRHFAMNFIEQYFADGSRVDVWEGDALAIAKDRIALRQNSN